MIGLFHFMEITTESQVELHVTICWSECRCKKLKLMESRHVKTKLYNDFIWLSDHLSFSITTDI